MLGRGVNERLKTEEPAYVWGDTLPIIRGAVVKVANLECVLTDKTQQSETVKPFYFRSDEKNVSALTEAGITAVSLANNHILDFGAEGMEETRKVLEAAGIQFAGAGESAQSAKRAAIFEVMGRKIGLISFSDNMPEWEAVKRPGIYRGKGLIQLIKETERRVEWLIVAAHWGGNWGYTVPEEHKKLAKAMIDAGADIIFGTSPHVFRGVEIYKQKLIIYSAGDFIDDYAVDEVERNDQSFIFMVETNSHKVLNLFLYPTIIANMGAQMAKGERNQIQIKMASLCADLGTTVKWNEMRGRLEVAL